MRLLLLVARAEKDAALLLAVAIMSLSELFENVMSRRDVVPCYYVRSANCLIVSGSGVTTAGAIILDDSGQVVAARPTKREALVALGCSTNNN